MVIGALLGVPERGPGPAPQVGRPDDALRARRHQRREARGDRAASASTWQAMVEDRRRTPQDDMVSDLLAAEITRDDGTTPPARPPRGDGVLHAARARRQRDHRAAARLGVGAARRAIPTSAPSSSPNPALMPNAVEELLRYEPPSPIQARFVTRDVEWHGHDRARALEDRAAHRQRRTRRARVRRPRPLRRRRAPSTAT